MFRLVLLCAISLSSALSQNTDNNCLGALGSKSAAEFTRFDQDLRAALRTHDAKAMSLLVEYPLRVNDSQGGYLVPSALALQYKYDQIFAPRLVAKVLRGSQQHVCNGTGSAYGSGEIWIRLSEGGLGVYVVNTADHKTKKLPSPNVVSCRTATSRSLVDHVDGDVLRYRSWKNSSSLFDKPDLEIRGGAEKREGTQGCAYTYWKFQNSALEVTVSQLGCFPDSNQPPLKATGDLSLKVLQSRTSETTEWCF